jgi:plasmid stabilization system protein ParE
MTIDQDRKINWSQNALRDLKRIKAFIRRNFSKEIADRSIKEILARVQTLHRFPDSGRLSNLPNPYGTPSRYVLKRKTRIYYTHDGQVVSIIRLLDTRQNPPQP